MQRQVQRSDALARKLGNDNHLHRRARQALAQRCQRRRTAEQQLREQANEDGEQRAHGSYPPAYPAHRTRQCDVVAAQLIRRRLKAWRLLHRRDHRFDLLQAARKARRQMIGQQTERAMPLRAVPARDTRTRRADAFVSAMANKTAATPRMQRAVRQTCQAPRFSGNVLGTGKPRLETKLHR